MTLADDNYPSAAQYLRSRLDISRIRSATPHTLDEHLVESHLLLDRKGDRLFRLAFREGLAALPVPQRRGRLATATGHVAESVIESILVDEGWIPIWHFATGGRGVDLVFISADFDRVLAIEVKGTLRPRY